MTKMLLVILLLATTFAVSGEELNHERVGIEYFELAQELSETQDLLRGRIEEVSESMKNVPALCENRELHMVGQFCCPEPLYENACIYNTNHRFFSVIQRFANSDPELLTKITNHNIHSIKSVQYRLGYQIKQSLTQEIPMNTGDDHMNSIKEFIKHEKILESSSWLRPAPCKERISVNYGLYCCDGPELDGSCIMNTEHPDHMHFLNLSQIMSSNVENL